MYKVLLLTIFISIISLAQSNPSNITNPVAGEDWRVGSSIDIIWDDGGQTVENIRIQYSIDGGSNWDNIIDSTTNDGEFIWTSIPNESTSVAKVRIAALNLSTIYAVSDSFAVTSISPSITASPVKILPLGNSITFGTDVTPGLTTGDLDSYRYKLWDLLRLNNYDMDFIGSEYSGYNIFPDYQNGGFGGTLVQHIKSILETGINTKFNPDDIITSPEKYLDVYTPDIVLLHIGTNVDGSLTNATAITFVFKSFDESCL